MTGLQIDGYQSWPSLFTSGPDVAIKVRERRREGGKEGGKTICVLLWCCVV